MCGDPYPQPRTRPYPDWADRIPKYETAHEGKLNISLDSVSDAERNTAVLWKQFDDRKKCGRMVWVGASRSALHPRSAETRRIQKKKK